MTFLTFGELFLFAHANAMSGFGQIVAVFVVVVTQLSAVKMTILMLFTGWIPVAEEEIPFTRGPSSFDGEATESLHSWIPPNTCQQKNAGKVHGCVALQPNGWH